MARKTQKQKQRKTNTKKKSNGEVTGSIKKCIAKCSGDGVSKFKRNLCIFKTAGTCPEYADYTSRSKACREQQCKNEIDALTSDTSLFQSETKKGLSECFQKKCPDLSLD